MSDQNPPADTAESDDVALGLYSLAVTVVGAMPRDISLTTAATLNLLERAGPQRMSHLAACEGVAQPSMTALVSKLERDGLAERYADPTDGRAVLVSLTAAGRRYVHDRRRASALMLADVIGRLPGDQARSLRAAMPALEAVVILAQDLAAAAGRPAAAARAGR
ncbi:MAG: MarR family winged helix-turn-helix transcriptional regulator [Streptosporangiaceae bacterium]